MSMYAQTLTVSVDGTRYTLGHGEIVKITTEREAARSARQFGSARDNAFILRDLRRWVADSLKIDQRTAYQLLTKITWKDLYV